MLTSRTYPLLFTESMKVHNVQSVSDISIRNIYQKAAPETQNLSMSNPRVTSLNIKNLYNRFRQAPTALIKLLKPTVLSIALRNLYNKLDPQRDSFTIGLPSISFIEVRPLLQKLRTWGLDETFKITLPNSIEIDKKDVVSLYVNQDILEIKIDTPEPLDVEVKNILNRTTQYEPDFEVGLPVDIELGGSVKPALTFPVLEGEITEEDTILGVNLTWDDASITHTGYTLYRDLAPIPVNTTQEPYMQFGRDVKQFDDPSVDEDTTYYYRVTPKTVYGNLFSNQVMLMVPLSLRAPGNITAIFSSLSEVSNVTSIIGTMGEPVLAFRSYISLSEPRYTVFTYEPSLDFTYVTFESSRLHQAVVTGKSYEGLSTILELSAEFSTQQSIRNFITDFNSLTTVGSAKHSFTSNERPVYMHHSFAGLTVVDANDPYVRLDSAVLDPKQEYTSQSNVGDVTQGYQGLTTVDDLKGEYGTLINVGDVHSLVDTHESVFDLHTTFKSLDNAIDIMQAYNGLSDVMGVKYNLVDIVIVDGSSTFESLTGTNQANVYVTNLKDLTNVRFSVDQGTKLTGLSIGFSSLDNLVLDPGECPPVSDIYPPEGFIAGCVVAGHENQYKAFDPTFEEDIAITTGELRTFNQRFGDMRKFLSRDNFTFINTPRTQSTGTLDLSTIQINRINECVFIWGSSFGNWSGDVGFGLYEFLDADHNLVFSLKNINTGTYGTGWIFTDNNGVSTNLRVRSYGHGYAHISFGDSKLWVKSANQGSGPYDHSFNCEYKKVVYLRTSARIHNSYTGGTGVTFTYLYLRESIPNPPKPDCKPKDLFNSLTGTSAVNQSMASLTSTSLVRFTLSDVPMLDDLSQEYTSLDPTERVSGYAMTLEGVYSHTPSCSTVDSCKIDGNSYSSLDSSLVMEPVYSSYSKPMSILGDLTTLEDVSNIHIHNSSEMVLDMYYKGFSSLDKSVMEDKKYASMDSVGVTPDGYWVYPEELQVGTVKGDFVYIGTGDSADYYHSEEGNKPVHLWWYMNQPLEGMPLPLQDPLDTLAYEAYTTEDITSLYAMASAGYVNYAQSPLMEYMVLLSNSLSPRVELYPSLASNGYTTIRDLRYQIPQAEQLLDATTRSENPLVVYTPRFYNPGGDDANLYVNSIGAYFSQIKADLSDAYSTNTLPIMVKVEEAPEPYYVQGGVQYTSQEAVKILNAPMPWEPKLP